jgi:hypothetical protein
MKTHRWIITARIFSLALLWAFFASVTLAHPGAGLVVDRDGSVFFVQTGEPRVFSGFVWRIDPGSRAASVHAVGAHWLALDEEGKFNQADLRGWFRDRITPNFERITLPGSAASLLQTDGTPFVIHRDGNLYFAQRHMELTRVSPDGKVTPLFPRLTQVMETHGGIKALATGPDGAFYVAGSMAVVRVTLDGTLTTVADRIDVPDCDRDPRDGAPAPGIRGLAVDEAETVYAAATGAAA